MAVLEPRASRPGFSPGYGVSVESDGMLPWVWAHERLAADSRCNVHLESGDEVVILEGEVEEVVLDESLADSYEAKYDYRPETPGGEGEAWYRLRPRLAYAWRERDFPRSATRFDFEGE